MSQPTINGNTITLGEIQGMSNVFKAIHDLGLDQFTVKSSSKAVYELSFPMNKDHHLIFAGLIHRQNAENKLNKKVDTKAGKPDDTPPDGGTSGAGKVVELQNTFAIAA